MFLQVRQKEHHPARHPPQERLPGSQEEGRGLPGAGSGPGTGLHAQPGQGPPGPSQPERAGAGDGVQLHGESD